jgi:hypothetical protein
MFNSLNMETNSSFYRELKEQDKKFCVQGVDGYCPLKLTDE